MIQMILALPDNLIASSVVEQNDSRLMRGEEALVWLEHWLKTRRQRQREHQNNDSSSELWPTAQMTSATTATIIQGATTTRLRIMNGYWRIEEFAIISSDDDELQQ